MRPVTAGSKQHTPFSQSIPYPLESDQHPNCYLSAESGQKVLNTYQWLVFDLFMIYLRPFSTVHFSGMNKGQMSDPTNRILPSE